MTTYSTISTESKVCKYNMIDGVSYAKRTTLEQIYNDAELF